MHQELLIFLLMGQNIQALFWDVVPDDVCTKHSSTCTEATNEYSVLTETGVSEENMESKMAN